MITLLFSDKELLKIQRALLPVMHISGSGFKSHGCSVKQATLTLSKVATRYIYAFSLSLNCTQHGAIKRKTSYHSKVIRVSQMQSVIYNIHSWISMLIISVQICTRGTALRMAEFPPMMISVCNLHYNTNGSRQPTLWVPIWQTEPPRRNLRWLLVQHSF